ncbi:MAG: DNA-binding response regulator [Nitrospirae bacterium GWC2_42_7]|nr:MAG: DNA-binding response regulator [Nitrospirae bacterium GWC2_42_7]
MLKILIADDHSVVRAGLKQILSGISDVAMVDEASNAREAIDKIKKNKYSVVVLDISMPGKSGLDALKEIRSEWPDLPVLILSMYPEDQYAIRVLKSGASGYMTKESAPEELVNAVRTVANGRKYVSPSLAEKLASHLDLDGKKEPHEMLSDREYQVLCMIASGKTVSEIADKLSLSVKTVSTYRSRILEKMKLKNSAELTTYAVQNHLID